MEMIDRNSFYDLDYKFLIDFLVDFFSAGFFFRRNFFRASFRDFGFFALLHLNRYAALPALFALRPLSLGLQT